MKSNRRIQRAVFAYCLIGAYFACAVTNLGAQEPETSVANAASAEKISASQIEELEADYQAKVKAWRETMEILSRTKVSYFDSTRDESLDLRDQWDRLKSEGQTHLEATIVAATNLFDAQEKPSPELADFMARVAEKSIRAGFSAEAFHIGQKLVATYPDAKNFQFLTAMSAIRVNEFEIAKKFFDENSDLLADVEKKHTKLFESIGELVTEFEREEELRKLDVDLPLATFETTKGIIKVELFEDQAPETVAHFISLIEQGYYDGKVFHGVIQDLVVETGHPHFSLKPVTVDLNYGIVDEFDRENARYPFRGSLGLGNNGEPDSGNERFFFCIQPNPFLHGKNTVFGRVIEGMNVVDSITHTYQINEDGESEPIEEAQLDLIVKATVTRKRPDSEYKFKKLPRVTSEAPK